MNFRKYLFSSLFSGLATLSLCLSAHAAPAPSTGENAAAIYKAMNVDARAYGCCGPTFYSKKSGNVRCTYRPAATPPEEMYSCDQSAYVSEEQSLADAHALYDSLNVPEVREPLSESIGVLSTMKTVGNLLCMKSGLLDTPDMVYICQFMIQE